MSFIKTKVSRPYAWVTLADLATLYQRIRLLLRLLKIIGFPIFFSMNAPDLIQHSLKL